MAIFHIVTTHFLVVCSLLLLLQHGRVQVKWDGIILKKFLAKQSGDAIPSL
jgi:hypothetical protein